MLVTLRKLRLYKRLWTAAAVLFLSSDVLAQGGANVAVTIRLEKQLNGLHDLAAEDVVVWLTPLDQPPAEPRVLPRATLVQKNKQFVPHLLVVQTGTMVDFPNLDPFFHNVFSMFNGKRFDLGLYESGSHRSVRFDREGVSFIFCNIHPEMGAVVVALNTPYYATSDAKGHVSIHDVPRGRYRIGLWSEHYQSNASQEAQVMTVDGSVVDLGVLQVTPKADPLQHHKNKFGEDYPHSAKPPY